MMKINSKEAYCSPEISMMLKKAGFNWDVHSLYGDKSDGDMGFSSWVNNYNSHDDLISAPTHQMAMEWLREEGIDIIPVIRHSLKYAQESPFRDYACRVYDSDGNIVMSATKWYSRYENAIEAALEYCLTNLI